MSGGGPIIGKNAHKQRGKEGSTNKSLETRDTSIMLITSRSCCRQSDQKWRFFAKKCFKFWLLSHQFTKFWAMFRQIAEVWAIPLPKFEYGIFWNFFGYFWGDNLAALFGNRNLNACCFFTFLKNYSGCLHFWRNWLLLVYIFENTNKFLVYIFQKWQLFVYNLK